MFAGRNLLIVTKHQKESVIAPILEKELGVKCFVSEHFDTDILGTFSGEIERNEDPISTARNKCVLALQNTSFDLAIASEGSFGPHPSLFFMPADDEFIVLVDQKNEIEIFARELSTETNYSASEIKSESELLDFAQKAKFPSHALILKNAEKNFTDIVKNISDKNVLLQTFNRFINSYGFAFIETDMRASYNPSRMKVIEKATTRLLEKINSLCPNCQTPGFSVITAQAGLPCSLCGEATRSTLLYLYRCQKCKHEKKEMYPNGKQHEDPMYCDHCNP